MGDEPKDLARVEPEPTAISRETEYEYEVRRLVAGVKRDAIKKAKKVLDSVDDATLLTDAAESKRNLPSRTAFALKVAEGVLAAEASQPVVNINIAAAQIVLPTRVAPDYSDAITVDPDGGDDD